MDKFTMTVVDKTLVEWSLSLPKLGFINTIWFIKTKMKKNYGKLLGKSTKLFIFSIQIHLIV